MTTTQRRVPIPARSSLLCALVFALAALAAVKSGDQLRYLDERDYELRAKSLISGQGYVNAEGRPTAYRPPGYPLLLAAVYEVWPRPLAAKLLNALMLAGIGWLLGEIVSVVTPQGKVFAPLLILLYPVFVYTATTLYPQVFGTLLFAGCVFCLVRFPDSVLSAAVCGLIFGVLILAVPSFLLILPVLAVFLLVSKRHDPWRASQSAAALVFCAAIVVNPWTIRNAITFKTFIPVSTNSGVTFLLGNCENAGVNTGPNVDISRYEVETKGMDEVQTDIHHKRAAMAWITGHPVDAAKLYLLKVANYFNFRNKLSSDSDSSFATDAVMFLSYYALLGAAIARCFLWRRYPFSPIERLCYFLYFGNALLSAIFFTRIRFRLPFDALLMVCVAIFLGHVLGAWRTQSAESRESPQTGAIS